MTNYEVVIEKINKIGNEAKGLMVRVAEMKMDIEVLEEEAMNMDIDYAMAEAEPEPEPELEEWPYWPEVDPDGQLRLIKGKK